MRHKDIENSDTTRRRIYEEKITVSFHAEFQNLL